MERSDATAATASTATAPIRVCRCWPASVPTIWRRCCRTIGRATRKSSEMAAMADVLTEDDIENLAAHYARQKARAVLFVPLPGK